MLEKASVRACARSYETKIRGSNLTESLRLMPTSCTCAHRQGVLNRGVGEAVNDQERTKPPPPTCR